MQLAPQPFVRAQQSLAAHWQDYQAAPQLRLSRWLTAESDRPLLHDYLVGLSGGPRPQLRRLPTLPDGNQATLTINQQDVSIIWLEHLGSKIEGQLRAHLASQNSVRLLVLEDAAAQPLRRLARWFPAAVHTCAPAVSMQQLLADFSHEVSVEEPVGRFQHQFHQLTEAIAQADSSVVTVRAAACLAICAALPGAGAPVTVWLASGHYFLAQKQVGEALRHFAAAAACAEAAFQAGDAGAGLLSMQVWLGEAAAWQQRRRGQDALAALQRAVVRAAHLEASLLGVEAAWQLGLALERNGQTRPALASYQQGLRFAEQLPPEQRSAATIQALGNAYINYLQTTPERQVVHARMAQLFT